MCNKVSCSLSTHLHVMHVSWTKHLFPLVYINLLSIQEQTWQGKILLCESHPPLPGLIAAMNQSKKFIRSISRMTKPSVQLYTPAAQIERKRERERERERRTQHSYEAKPGTGEHVQNDKDLFSAMIKY